MEPQPWELRKQVSGQSAQVAALSFNGAAALGAAETCASWQPRVRCSRFNGAAALGAAETLAHCQRAHQSSLASMEPQPWELRKHHVKHCPGKGGKASMEPQPWELRKQPWK